MLYGGVLAEATDVVFANGFVHKFFVRAISSRDENSTARAYCGINGGTHRIPKSLKRQKTAAWT